MPIKTLNLFPTLIAQGNVANSNKLNKKLLIDITTLSKKDKMGIKWSKENYLEGYTSYASLCDLHHRTPAFSQLAEDLQKEALLFAKKLGWRLKGLKLEMTACWMNIMPKNTYHTSHTHPHSVLSGAYYVSVPKGSESLKLEDPKMLQYMNAPVRENTSLYHSIQPKPGSFVLFESWLRHEVPPNQSDKSRISISFNFSIVDKD